MDDAKFVWNFLTYRILRVRERAGPVLFQGKAVERKFLQFSNIQLPTCRHWGARG